MFDDATLTATPVATLDAATTALIAGGGHDPACCENRVMDVAENDYLTGYVRDLPSLVEEARNLFAAACSC